MRKLIIFITSGFYSGYVPVASGTFGTLVGILYFLAVKDLDVFSYLFLLLGFTVLSCFLAGKAEKFYGEKDSGKIVIDEIVGYLVTLFAMPASIPLLHKVVVGFFLFRFFDIVKPFPARHIDQKVKGGVGVVMDDFVAGIYANLAMRLFFFMWTKIF